MNHQTGNNNGLFLHDLIPASTPEAQKLLPVIY